ncbi:uncharacterized protein BCR38DRAFT_520878 [Pseudomassariella vexata]|uniref:rRNA biogenesis protein RRP5 n=1 Tax=Pseudomassariella vexata TaxID=1141098 RepID=A0A1Y2EEK5_9PEZI|nr:uncharacterized protein BCR38DRAFT_520878 [Pseudomassariella vexata]ORY70013.1 hypothetical protein BCR38DRAFT_520878 [Pseudomassariella vexata]
MSSAKRKDAPGGTSAAKVPKTRSDSRPSKSPKSEKAKFDSKTSSKPSKTSESKPAAAPSISRLKEEEPLFPRGGGSILSPLEHKQIHVQAKQDVLFEQESGQAKKKAERAHKKPKGQSNDGKASKPEQGGDTVKIESLNYKRLVKGSMVLGQVAEINALDISLALPNNLVGHVPITSISETLNERIATEAAEAAEDDENDKEAQEDDGVDLKSLFRLGQYIRAYVVSTIEETTASSGKPRRHIELSLRPDQTNSGLSSKDVVTNCTVMAAVASVEDHGFVMELGLEDSKLRAFLARKEVDETIPESQMQPGSVFLCLVTGKNGQVAQLSTLQKKMGSIRNHASEATTINTFLPGSAVELLVTDISGRGLAGKVMGSLDVTADVIHSGAGPQALDLGEKYKVGKKTKARVICTFPTADDPKLGVSLLDHIVSLEPKTVESSNKSPVEVIPLSSIVEKCTVTSVEPEIGVFVDIGIEGVSGFVHISRLKDGKVDMVSESTGPFKLQSVHRGRVVGYNAVDGVFQLSFEQHVLEQPFLRLEDIPVGEIVHGIIEKLVIGPDGVSGLLVKLAEGLTGFVPEIHLADVKLQHPEKKFREGMKVKSRVLSTDLVKRQIRLTLKKTLINSEAIPLKSFDEVAVGLQVPATIINVLGNGAVVQFYGSMRGFLPIAEMSEAYIRDPKEYFRVGQVVDVHVLNFDAVEQKLYVSCKNPAAFGIEKQLALKKLSLGDIISAKVVQKTEGHVFVELVDNSLRAMISVGHLADGSTKKNQAVLKKIYVGQTLTDLVVLDKIEGRRFIALSKKPSLMKASQEGKLLTSFDDVKVGQLYPGYVKNITATAVYVQFAGPLTALVPKSRLPQTIQKEASFGMEKHQSFLVKISSVDRERQRIFAAHPDSEKIEKNETAGRSSHMSAAVENPVDEAITSTDDVSVGRVTKAKIVSVKGTQLNVKLADNIQGRVDMSSVFDSWDEITDVKAPLRKFHQGDVIPVRVLGVHDAKNHRFLPISHRSTSSILELSSKPSDVKGAAVESLSYEKLENGSTYVAFVNKVQDRTLWVNLSPNVRGRINTLDISDDVSLLENLSSNFPVGSALRVRVLAVDPSQGRLDLSARSSVSSPALTWGTVKKNMVLPGRITKINERQIMVQLSETVSGPIHLADISDDFDDANTMNYSKNSVIRVSIVDLDKSNKKVRLSSRHSRVLNSSAEVKDREFTDVSQVVVGDIVRGFVKNVSDKGLFVTLGGDVTTMVKISDLSDRFLKDWKDSFQVDQIVKGRVTSVDPTVGQIQMNLKPSVVEKDYVPLLNYQDLREAQIVTGKVRKVEEFGAFILVDGSNNVSGLCHRSEMAEKSVDDARKLFSEGDAVKAIILKLDKQKRRINFGLKPSYFEGEGSDESDDDDAGAPLISDDEDEDMDDNVSAVIITGTDNVEEEEPEGEDMEMTDAAGEVEGLDAGGFDWDADAVSKKRGPASVVDEKPGSQDKKKKRRKAQIEVDKSGDLDAFGPRTAADYEQLLNRQPNSSTLWIEYMAYQLQSSELAEARKVVERAITTINSVEETEKLNAWIAYLNLEVRFGTEETVEEVFKRACQVNDQQEVFQRLASIYIQEDKPEKADELFQALVKKFGSTSPEVWYNYGHWLHAVQNQPDRAKALMPRAIQALPTQAHLPLMTKFAGLHFSSENKNPELGRTMFEGLIAQFPKRFDLWKQLLDHEDVPGADKAVVRDVFERALKAKGLKPRAAKKWFKRWADWEEKNGDQKSREKVGAKAAEWVRARTDSKADAGDEEDADDD